MFTGLVQDLGTIEGIDRKAESAVIRVKTSLAPKIALGDSISVDGVCLTATSVDAGSFTADVMIQTLKVTSLKIIDDGSRVNLELARAVDERLGGHIVQGHVDGVGEVISLQESERWWRLDVKIPATLLRYIVNQGSITINGVSLTVGEVDDEKSVVTVWLIPETLQRTNLGLLKANAPVNIEVDVLAKYVERIVKFGDKK
ncbi:MAG: riboflavin synthase [Candidatus Nanopelagicaceae bacterium]|jgi:riboflavin synthase